MRTWWWVASFACGALACSKKEEAPPPPPAAPAAEPVTLLDVAEDPAVDSTRMNAALVKPAPVEDDETRIYRQVRSRLSSVNYCYAKQRRIEPSLAGKLIVKITVAPSPEGSVTSAEITERSLRSPPVETCVLTTVKAFAFQRRGKEPLSVQLPFVFR